MNRVLIKKHKWKNDLGDGFYCYIDEQEIIGKSCFDSPKENAKKYYANGKGNELSQRVILRVECSFNNYEKEVLDLTNLDTLSSFNKFVKYAMEIAEEHPNGDDNFNIIRKISLASNRSDARARRGVVDGFFIDNYIKFVDREKAIKAVVKTTATDFGYINNQKWKSQVDNGCEMCIKDISCICNICIAN